MSSYILEEKDEDCLMRRVDRPAERAEEPDDVYNIDEGTVQMMLETVAVAA